MNTRVHVIPGMPTRGSLTGFMRLLRKYCIYSCISRKSLYQFLILEVGVRFTIEIRLTHALRGSVPGGFCKHTHTHDHIHAAFYIFLITMLACDI